MWTLSWSNSHVDAMPSITLCEAAQLLVHANRRASFAEQRSLANPNPRREEPERVPVHRRVPGGSCASGPRCSHIKARAPNWWQTVMPTAAVTPTPSHRHPCTGTRQRCTGTQVARPSDPASRPTRRTKTTQTCRTAKTGRNCPNLARAKPAKILTKTAKNRPKTLAKTAKTWPNLPQQLTKTTKARRNRQNWQNPPNTGQPPPWTLPHMYSHVSSPKQVGSPLYTGRDTPLTPG